jgi:hypothetical protein
MEMAFMPTVSSLVDAFVQKVNSEPRETQPPDVVPEFLRETTVEESDGEASIGWTDWRIVKHDNLARIDELQKRIGWPFPPSFQYFLTNYSFPAFESGPLLFFANTGQATFWELEVRLFTDPHLSPALLRAGFLQVGNPFFYNYDPVCFDCKVPEIEKRIVQLDHEQILCNDRIMIVKEVAPSFPTLLHGLLRDKRS